MTLSEEKKISKGGKKKEIQKQKLTMKKNWHKKVWELIIWKINKDWQVSSHIDDERKKGR